MFAFKAQPAPYAQIFSPLLLMLAGCDSGDQNGDATLMQIEKWKLRIPSDDIVNSYPEYPHFLKVRVDPDFDLIFDDQFSINRNANYMSVLPSEFGQASKYQLGRHTVHCYSDKPYSCALRFDDRSGSWMILFRQKPADTKSIDEKVERSRRIISSWTT